MKKQEVIERNEQLKQVNCYVAPTKTIDSGASGKSFEIDVKLFLNGRIATKQAIATIRKIDTRFKGLKIEIKSNCGTLDGIENNDYVVYSPNATLETARVFTPTQFMELVNACGLFRTKKTSSGYFVKAIQSYKNSMKKSALWYSTLKQNGLSLAEFKALHA